MYINNIIVMKPKNLFLQPSVMIAFLSIFIIQGDSIFDSIISNGFTARNIKDLIVTVVVVSGIVAERYEEDEDGVLYTPKYVPGRNFEDANKNGIPDHLENKNASVSFDEGVVSKNYVGESENIKW